MDLIDITQLFKYTEWANDLAMDAATKLSGDKLRRDVGISHKSIFGTLLHMAGAEWIWLERWNGRSPAKDEAWSQWTPQSCTELAVLTDKWSGLVDRRWKYLSERGFWTGTQRLTQVIEIGDDPDEFKASVSGEILGLDGNLIQTACGTSVEQRME